MPHDPRAVDALLATVVHRLMMAAAAAKRTREMRSQGRVLEYWRAVAETADHATIAGHAIQEANRLMADDLPIFLDQKGGLPN